MEKGLIIVLINLVVYFRSLYFGYVGDDIEVAESTKKRKEAYKSKWRRLWGEFIIFHNFIKLLNMMCF